MVLLSTNTPVTQVDALKYDVLDLSEVLLTEREETAVRLEECLDVSCAIVAEEVQAMSIAHGRK